MGVQSQIMHGARAQLIVNGRIVGCFTQVSYGVNYDAQPSHILGRFSPVEITYTGQEAVSITATGFRVVDNGAYKAAGLPQLQNLMTAEDIVLEISDRQTGKKIFTATGARPVSYSSAQQARSVSDFSVTYLALRANDESHTSSEASDASDLTSGQ